MKTAAAFPLFLRIPFLAFALAALVIGRGEAAAQQPGLTAFPSGQANIIVSGEGKEYLNMGTAVWGPNWAWTSVEGKLRSENGATLGALTSKVDGKTLKLDFHASHPTPNSIELNYALKAEAEAGLTLFAVEFAPGKTFERRDIVVESAGKTNAVRAPFAKGTIGEGVSSMRLRDARGKETVLRFDPPCEIAADGAAPILLAKDRIEAGAIRRLKVTIDLPSAVDWYSSVNELPDEAGLAEWYPWRATGVAENSILGMEDWLERPAGKHGRIARQGDKLMYDNQPIKLWGVNLCYGTCAPEKALADKRAAFYRKQGINAVRLHKFADNTGWSGIQSKDSCVEYDPAGLDRMDYQIAKFKEAGIYVKLSAHFGSLKLGPADKQYAPFIEEFGPFRDGRIETPHSAIHYSPELQKVQILQMVNLLKHKNPHSGLLYAKDPAIAFIEIINEQSILFYTSMGPLKASLTLRNQVGARFCDWLRKKYETQTKLELAWGKTAFDCFAGDGFKAVGEQLDKNNILPLGNPWYWDPSQLNGSQASKKQRLLDTLQFLYELECGFYDRYIAAMREAGYEGEIVASNWQAGRALSHYANLLADTRAGTIDRHNYFGGGRANASMLSRAGSGVLSSGMQQVAGYPFMMSEWIHVFPSEYGVEGPAILAAYGMGLQGWDVSFMFQNGDNGGFSPKIGRDQWDATAPQIMGLFPAVARQIYRGDVKASDVVAKRYVHAPSLFEGRLGFDEKVAQGYDEKELDGGTVPARSLAAVRTEVEFTDGWTETPAFNLKSYERDGQLASATGHLRWRESGPASDGSFTLDTPGSKAAVGFALGQKCELGAVTIEPKTRFCAIYVTAREKDNTIESSRDILVTALARARNTGMKFSPGGDKMLVAGAAPILIEPVKATLTLRRQGSPKVYLLDHDGSLTERTLPIENGVLNIDGAKDKTPYYLIRY
jgi:hypothetical protein